MLLELIPGSAPVPEKKEKTPRGDQRTYQNKQHHEHLQHLSLLDHSSHSGDNSALKTVMS